ncbi:MAG TPA: bifunctional 5,10-methylenetetrahydrofolate dehydrogenase/5,10-methenyltetrahydrofolate cyclohydrolase [Chloroflexi bacterium]|jgi:methylenetetrahydrofolate dehydrogenase (NADP+)/methenyltetrahydrofolate cyclohydrolase|nr:bifunctional 5,10-methylenetetrahydrofolate dehydrogenase/5,10-methenyltetrahydrofolate cyclohydrolase [Chloroflexota bacterium]
MTAQILDGRALAKTMRGEIAQEVERFHGEHGWVPGIAVVQVGEDPASSWYVKQIARSFGAVGMRCTQHTLPADASADDLAALLRTLNADPRTNGVIVQMPLPDHLPSTLVTDLLDPAKDVDGIHPLNAGRLMQQSGEALVPATPAGGMEILARYGIALRGRHAVMVGRSNIVGRPMALLMLHQHATVTICHSRTPDLGAMTRQADILVAAVGRPKIITGDMIRPGAVVIDFGVNVVEGALAGDVDTEAAMEVAGYVTPVPGGTGPMTNVMLMENTLTAAKRQATQAHTP